MNARKRVWKPANEINDTCLIEKATPDVQSPDATNIAVAFAAPSYTLVDENLDAQSTYGCGANDVYVAIQHEPFLNDTEPNLHPSALLHILSSPSRQDFEAPSVHMEPGYRPSSPVDDLVFYSLAAPFVHMEPDFGPSLPVDDSLFYLL